LGRGFERVLPDFTSNAISDLMWPNDTLDLGIRISIVAHKTQKVLELKGEGLPRTTDEWDIDDRLRSVCEWISLFLVDVPIHSEV
jgi:hypothetical protein